MKYSVVITLITLSAVMTLCLGKVLFPFPTPSTTTAPSTTVGSSTTSATPSATTTAKAPIKLKLCWRGNNWCNLTIPARNQRCKSFFGMLKCYY
ncbi:hypothetical protein ACLKA7_015833 [Drosophila subpalustris]